MVQEIYKEYLRIGEQDYRRCSARLSDVAHHPATRVLQHLLQAGSGPTDLADHGCESLCFLFLKEYLQILMDWKGPVNTIV